MDKRFKKILRDIHYGQKFIIFPRKCDFNSARSVLEKIDHGFVRRVRDGKEMELPDDTEVLLLDF